MTTVILNVQMREQRLRKVTLQDHLFGSQAVSWIFLTQGQTLKPYVDPRKLCRYESRKVPQSDLWLCLITKVKETDRRREWYLAGQRQEDTRQSLPLSQTKWRRAMPVRLR